MPAKILIFFSGLVLGVLIMFALRPSRHSMPPPTPVLEPAAPQLTAAKERAGQLEAEVVTLKAEIERMKTQATKVTTPEAPLQTKSNRASPWAAFFGGGSDTNRAAGMEKMMKAAVKQQVESQLAGLKRRLRLTDEQEQAVRGAVERQYGLGVEMAGKAMEGKLSKEETAQLVKAADLKTTLKEVLTPEQYAEYERYEIEQRQSSAQLMANAELMQVQPMLQLTEEQQDKVFEILYQRAEEQMTAHTNFTSDASFDWRKQWEQLQQSKKDGLRSVLTEEQYQSYEKFLKSQEEMMKAFMPASDETNAVSSHVIPVLP